MIDEWELGEKEIWVWVFDKDLLRFTILEEIFGEKIFYRRK